MRGGEFATANRGGASQHIAFIYEKAQAGVPLTAIAAMIGTSVGEVAALAPPVPRRATYGTFKALPPEVPVIEPGPRAVPKHVMLILREVADAHGVSVDDIRGDRRLKHITLARHEACWRLRNETAYSTTQIGWFLGGKDHSSVMHGERRHAERLQGAFVAVTADVLTEVVP